MTTTKTAPVRAPNGKTFAAPTLTAFAMDPDELVIIGLDTQDKAGEHPLYDERIHLPVNEALVQSIMAHGFKRTLPVRKEGTQAVLVDGRQGVRAAREANKRLRAAGLETVSIPVLPERGLQDANAMGLMILANELRTDDDTMTRATKAARYLGTGKTMEQVALAFGVAESTVSMWMDLLELHPDVQVMVKAGQLGAKAASKLAKLDRAGQLRTALELVAAGRATTEGAAAAVRAAKAAQAPAPAAESSETAPAKAAKAAPAFPRPALSDIRAVLKAVAKGNGNLSLEVRLALAWVAGEGPAADVEGLQAILDALVGKSNA